MQIRHLVWCLTHNEAMSSFTIRSIKDNNIIKYGKHWEHIIKSKDNKNLHFGISQLGSYILNHDALGRANEQLQYSHNLFGFFGGFLPHCTACGILVPQPRIEPMPPAVEAQSLNHWTAREVPGFFLNF